jgi:hypothetical protein
MLTKRAASVNARTYSVEDEDLDTLRERLNSIEDEELWQRSHTKMIVSYNAKSLAFWVLCFLTLCFATLNGYHGYTASGASVVGVSAMVIGFLYFNIELTIPISAHLMFWGNKGDTKIAIRLIGTLAFILGVMFSILIIQGKFSSGADSSSARQEATAIVFGSDKDQLVAAKERSTELRERVGGRSSSSFGSEIEAILASPMGKKGETIGTKTRDCLASRKTGREREMCSKVDTLRRLKEDAISLEKSENDIKLLTENLTDVERTSVRSADSQDKVISEVIGQDAAKITLFRPSLIAVMAALLTHMLWAAHGRSVSLAIDRRRDGLFNKNKLRRVVDRRTKLIEDVKTQESDKRSKMAVTQHVIDSASLSAPLSEKSSPAQVMEYLNNYIIKVEGASAQVGLLHDHYSNWCKQNRISVIPIDRFSRVLKDLNHIIADDGRVVGVSLKI